MKSRTFYTDAAVVFICCALLVLTVCAENTVEIILILLICTAVLLVSTGRLLYIWELLLPAVSIFVPEIVTFIPAALFVSAANRHKLPALTEALFLIVCIARNNAQVGFICAAAVSLLSAGLGLRSGEAVRRGSELIRTRDNDTELEMELRQMNAELRQKQDDEVNIATLKERNRIAREIHDNVGHLLSRALLQSGALLAITDKEKMPAQYAQVSALKETLGSAMNSIRESVHGLRDDSIDLHHAVHEAAESVSGRFKVTTELDFSEKMPAKVKLCFIAVIKEALSNSVKHSDGDRIEIVVREHPALYQLYVTDNGSPQKTNSGGMGLNNMRERAEDLGGFFRVDTSDGFRIFISVKRGAK